MAVEEVIESLEHRFAIAEPGEVIGCVVKTPTGLATVPASKVIGWAVKTPTGLATVSTS